MDNNVTVERTLFFALLRQGMGEKVTLSVTPTAEQVARVWRLAKKQGVAHIVAAAPDWDSLLSSDSPLREEATRLTVLTAYHCEQQQYALAQVGELFAQAAIPYLPLKGAVLRDWYPTPWLRSGCDVDILVRPADLDKASALLTEKLGCRAGKIGAHDRSFFTDNRVHIELHYQLVEEGRAGKAAEVLADVWNKSAPVKESAFRYEMPDPLFYFYHIAHMAKHMQSGGCGVRFFLDLWVLENRPHSREERDALLRQGGLLAFADAGRRLADWWFGDGQADATLQRMQSYVFGGGVFGSRANKAAAGQATRGKGGHLVSRIFPSAEALQWDYPVLQRYSVLLPVCWVRRWCRRLAEGRLSDAVHTEQMADARAEAVAALLRELEL